MTSYRIFKAWLKVPAAAQGMAKAAGLLFSVTLTAAATLWLPQASAHGGLSMEKDMCKLRIGSFFMHFTGYQVRKGFGGNQEFCEDIPEVGRVIIVMDAIDSELREMPIDVRIISDDGTGTTLSGSQLDDATVMHLPSKVYMTGTIPLDHNFRHAGHYVGLVTAGAEGQYVSRFPFSVGIKKINYWEYGLIIAVILAGLGMYRYSSGGRRKRISNWPARSSS